MRTHDSREHCASAKTVRCADRKRPVRAGWRLGERSFRFGRARFALEVDSRTRVHRHSRSGEEEMGQEADGFALQSRLRGANAGDAGWGTLQEACYG